MTILAWITGYLTIAVIISSVVGHWLRWRNCDHRDYEEPFI